MQQPIPRLTVDDLVEGSAAPKDIKDVKAIIVFLSASGGKTKASITTFSDATFNISAHQAYSQTSVLT